MNKTIPVCEICGGSTFSKGLGGRLSRTKELPRCTQCGSLERHRAIRKCFIELKALFEFESYSALQISKDFSVDSQWFDKLEVSIYDEKNSLDIQKIDRATSSYDFVICNHVLEHVKYDNSGLNELLRICRPAGFVFLTVPAPYQVEITRDWGYPDEAFHGHYRVYGKDIIQIFERFIPFASICRMVIYDPITNTNDWAFILSKKPTSINKIISSHMIAEKIQ